MSSARDLPEEVSNGTYAPGAGLEVVAQLVWSPDGAYVAVADIGATLWIWETARWRHACWSWPSPAAITAVCWSPDSRCAVH
jgi:WD40 repeat protein